MLARFAKWLQLKRALSRLHRIPGAANTLMALKTEWLENPQTTQGFTRHFVNNEALLILKAVLDIMSQHDPVIVNRQALARTALQFARLQVLVMEPAPAQDVTGLRGQPGITGHMREHVARLAESEPWLRGLFEALRLEDLAEEDRFNIVLARYRQSWIWAEVFNAVRVDLDDYVRPTTEDWYKPCVAAACAAYEHECRRLLGMPPALYDGDGLADRRAEILDESFTWVAQGHLFPSRVWSESIMAACQTTQPS